MSYGAPPGVNLSDDTSSSIIASVVVCMVLSGLALLARFASRWLQETRPLASDYLCVIGLVGAWVISLIVIRDAEIGLGRHIEVVPMSNVKETFLVSCIAPTFAKAVSSPTKTSFITELFYAVSFTVIKLSILLLFRHLFPGKGMVLATNLVGAFVVAWGVALFIVSFFACTPVQANWDFTVPATCLDGRWLCVGFSIPNIMADIAIMCVPVRRIWKLQMSKKSKLAVSGMFLMGSFVIVASVLRIYFMLNMDVMDITWSNQGVALWSAVEIDVAVICACLPTVRPAVKCIWPSSLTLRSSKKSGSAHSDQTLNLPIHRPTSDMGEKETFYSTWTTGSSSTHFEAV